MKPSDGYLTTHGVCKTYRGRAVVQNVSLAVKAGEIVGLLGPNGAGKTTTFYMLVGLIRPDSGTVCLEGRALTHLPMHRRARLGIGYLPQEASVFRRMTVAENILAILETVSTIRAERLRMLEELLAEFGLTGLQDTLGQALSGGERRRVELARLLSTSPRFVLLDEPFTGIDPIMVQDIQTFVCSLKAKGIGILITDHRVQETLGITDRAYILHEGRILHEGTPEELVANAEVKQVYLGEGFNLQ
ncbi:MAG: LPS export ABC transporter ATP-binding protein [Candidatus Tectomicrobia bacterium]|nr:LPS export ABC transporter ATP-binding protein [Candidatus Tectomicrobia bacterium]